MHKLVLISLCALTMAACASKNKAEKIDTKIDIPAAVSNDSVIGVKDGNLVYQRKVMMNEELHRLETTVYDLEARVYGGPRYLDNRGLYGVLKDCRAEMSEYKNGGDGKLLWTEKRDYVTPDDEYTNIGIENKRDIVGVSEEYLADRLARFKNYKNALIDRQEEFETKVKVCKLALSVQRGERSPSSVSQ
jgi:hypothetical protein